MCRPASRSTRWRSVERGRALVRRLALAFRPKSRAGRPNGHPRSWRTARTIPVHAPRLNATVDQRRMVERQSIEFMASPCNTLLAAADRVAAGRSETLANPMLLRFHRGERCAEMSTYARSRDMRSSIASGGSEGRDDKLYLGAASTRTARGVPRVWSNRTAAEAVKRPSLTAG